MILKQIALLLSLAGMSMAAALDDHEYTPALIEGVNERSLQASDCDVKAEVLCFIEGSGKRRCDEIGKVPPGAECRSIAVRLRYNVCNNSPVPMQFRDKTFARFRREDVGEENFRTTNLDANTCRIGKQVFRSINTCENNVLRAGLKIEGWIVGRVGQNNAYCYDYNFMDVDTGTSPPTSPPTLPPTVKPTRSPTSSPSASPTSSPTATPTLNPTASPTLPPTSTPTANPTNNPTAGPTVSPTAFPTAQPTLSPTAAPTGNPGAPDFDVEIACFSQDSSGAFTIRCEAMSAVTNASQCAQNFKYIYTVTNKSSLKTLSTQGLVLRHGNNDLANLPLNNNVDVAPLGSIQFEEQVISRDVCVKNGATLPTSVIAIASNPVDKAPASADDDYTFTLPTIPLQWELDQQVECFIGDSMTTCNDYISTITSRTADQCVVDVTFKYTIENTGFACNSIDTISASIDDISERALALDSIQSCSDRDFCPDDEWELADKRTIDICAYSGQNASFELTLNGADNGNNDEGVYSFAIAPLPTTAAPTVAPTSGSAPTRCQCTDRPSEMYFMFGDGLCGDSSNQLSRRLDTQTRSLRHKGSKSGSGDYSDSYFNCEDKCSEIASPSMVIITDRGNDTEYFKGTVSFGDKIAAVAPHGYDVDSWMNVKVLDMNGKIAQEFDFHSSCSKPLWTGDVFGALTLIGWKNDDQGLVGM